MKIEIEIPDWVEGKHLYIFAGIELVAYKYLDENWKVKTGRCNMCGLCCEEFKKPVLKWPFVKNKTCEYLKSDGEKKVCGLALHRPFACCVGIKENKKDCLEKFEIIE